MSSLLENYAEFLLKLRLNKIDQKQQETHVNIQKTDPIQNHPISIFKKIDFIVIIPLLPFNYFLFHISYISSILFSCIIFLAQMRFNARHSTHFQLNSILDQTSLPQPSSFNDFGNFIYTDHVTRIKYKLKNLKTKQNPSIHANETIQSFIKTHKKYKSTNSLSKFKSYKFPTDHIDQVEVNKRELLHFLEHLQMINTIRKNRNHVVSGIERVEKRKSLFPKLTQCLVSSKLKAYDIDIIKRQIRKKVNGLSTQLFRDYIENSEPYREVFNQLSIASSKGGLNTRKINKIKQKIQDCTKIKNDKKTSDNNIIKRRQLDTKENQRYDKYFFNAAKQIDQEIHFKIKQQASFNWKYGKREALDYLMKDQIKNNQNVIKNII